MGKVDEMDKEKVETPKQIWIPQSALMNGGGSIYIGQAWDDNDTEYVRVDHAPNTRQRACRACDKGLRLAPDGLHYDDEHSGQTWGVCDKVVETLNARQRAERAARRLALEMTMKEFAQACLVSLDWEDIPEPVSKAIEKMTDIIAAEFEK